ncbi:protein phosphatase, putative [Plasmodium vivax]|uniref:PPM-type phosphatase domain-containing protein n=2 Tax=Plasmodium vivax TaxID=5855 RepID=A5K1Z7_PLAVS|nr:hypothetical protein, conserved [Plasmodium vivax]EDL46447.1 hypothetical protein, conserved [Plasmodium vivax]KMZ85690.1 hypothetical protein PVBG_01200 [Plasmodium vivax Brazil I]CAI7721472.1 protein phosphatase, putative [Plasmodium vivax]|eukprot:XP_001616174.1 hypothetical protein [Plasmodium vivax Sal-1]
MDPLPGDEFEQRCDILLRKTNIKNVLIPREESGTSVSINFAEDEQKGEGKFKRARVRVRVRRRGKGTSTRCFSLGRTATKLGKFLSGDTLGKLKSQNGTSSGVNNKMNHSIPWNYPFRQNHRETTPQDESPSTGGELSQFDDSQERGKKKSAAVRDLHDGHSEESAVNPHKGKKQKRRHDSPGGKPSTIADWLATHVRNYANCSYLLGRKKCYKCFMATKGVATAGIGTVEAHTDGVHPAEELPSKGKPTNERQEKKRRQEKTNKSFTFSYGFYSKKGKYHDNEDTCSHASFSSFEIQKEVEQVIRRMGSGKMKFNLFDEVLKSFCIRSSSLRHRDGSAWGSKPSGYRNGLKPPAKPSNGGTCRVYLKPALPVYHLEGGNPPTGPPLHHMICRYFYEEKSGDQKEGNKRTQRREKRNVHKDTHDVEEGVKKLQLKCLTRWREKTQLLDAQGEELHQTYNPNLRFSHYYKFVCKVCKKCQHVNAQQGRMLPRAYLRYLHGVPKRGGKRKKDEAYHRMSGYTSSSCSDEFNYVRCSPPNVNKRYGGEGSAATGATADGDLPSFFTTKQMNRSNPLSGDTHEFIHGEEKNHPSDSPPSGNATNSYGTLGDYLTSCKMCRHLLKYDNMANDFLLTFWKNNYFLKHPFCLNRSEKKMLNLLAASQEREKTTFGRNFKNDDERRGGCHFWSHSDVDTYQHSKELQMWKDELERCSTRRNAPNEWARRGSPFRSFLKRRRQKMILSREWKSCVDKMRRYLFEEYYTKFISAKEAKPGEGPSNGSSKHRGVDDNSDMHLFTICDGHGDSHASHFLIQNVNKVFYFLLVHTLFNVYISLKILHPLLDFLYYRECVKEKRNSYAGACIINILLRGNYLYVNNTGDCRCALMTFHLDRFEYNREGSAEEREDNSARRKKRRGGKSKRRAQRAARTVSSDFGSDFVSDVGNHFGSDRHFDREYQTYVINEKSLSYNELNCEHNCNSYVEYLRMYKMHFCEELAGRQVSTGEGHPPGERRNENGDSSVSVPPADKFERGVQNDEQMEALPNVKKTKRRADLKRAKMDSHLNKQIAMLNGYLLSERGKEINIGNLSYDLIKYNRVDGCLHPCRVIGDYDLKRKYYNGHFTLSNDSNVYKYDLNNINLVNMIRYLYLSKFCRPCSRSYLLSSYGKIGPIRQIVLLDVPEEGHQWGKTHTVRAANLHRSTFVSSAEVPPKPLKPCQPSEGRLPPAGLCLKIYRDGAPDSNVFSSQAEKKKENFAVQINERFAPYINIKRVSMNENYLCWKERRNFFHLLIIASDGVFEYVNPHLVLNILKKNKSVYAKVRKIYRTYDMREIWTTTAGSTPQRDINKMMHRYMPTKEDCTKLARDIVKSSIMHGNLDDSTCFCIFIFPTFFVCG